MRHFVFLRVNIFGILDIFLPVVFIHFVGSFAMVFLVGETEKILSIIVIVVFVLHMILDPVVIIFDEQ